MADNNTYPICGVEYRSYAGVRQHMKKAHALEYNRELEVRYEEAPVRKEEWTDAHFFEMARQEIAYERCFIDVHLHSLFPTRNITLV